MWIEHVEIHGRRGVGWIVLWGLLLFTAPVGMVISYGRMRRIRLRNEPQVRLFGAIPLGGAVVWGAVLLTLGGLLCMGFLMTDAAGKDDWLVFFWAALPQALTGAFLMLHGARYRNYLRAADRLLERIATVRLLPASGLEIAVPGAKFDDAEVRGLLADLVDNGIVCSERNADGTVSAWIVDPNLLQALPDGGAAAGEMAAASEWTCAACGAPNRTPQQGVCAWCGAQRPEA